MECLLCSRADSSVFERSGLLMCKACYDAGVAADMAVARVYRFEPADHVADNIFLGPEGATIDDAWLREKGITRVLTVAAHSDHLTKHASIEYMQIDVDDDPNELLRPHFEAAFAFMREDAATNVLVHCVSGISRSATVVTAYLMATRKLPSEAALALVRERRPVVSPNSGFQRQLREYAAELLKPPEAEGCKTGGDAAELSNEVAVGGPKHGNSRRDSNWRASARQRLRSVQPVSHWTDTVYDRVEAHLT